MLFVDFFSARLKTHVGNNKICHKRKDKRPKLQKTLRKKFFFYLKSSRARRSSVASPLPAPGTCPPGMASIHVHYSTKF